MAKFTRGQEKQVRLTVFDNEPMARLAEQRLRQQGIPSIIRSLRGGPGLWGSAYNLPHDLYVFESDETAAREVLELAPPQDSEGEDQVSSTQRSAPNLWLLLAGAVLGVLFLLIMVSVFSRPLG